MMHSQDILILLKLSTGVEAGPWLQQDLARDLGLSPAEVHKALARAAAAGLYQAKQRKVMRGPLLEFLVHGLKYVFPARLGGPSRGVPTAWAAPVLADQVVSNEADRPVWPHGEGNARGPSVSPLYETAPDAALRDPKLYELLALVDAIRLGGARDRKLAADALQKNLEQTP